MLNDAVSGIKWSSVNVTMDGGITNLWVENNKTKVEGGWKIWVDLSFSDGSHTVKVEVKSNASNTGIKTWSFTVDSSPLTENSIRFSHYIGRVGQTITIYVDIYNNGTNGGLNYIVKFYNGSNLFYTIDSFPVNAGETKTVDFNLTTGTGETPTLWFDYSLSVYTVPVQSETRTDEELLEFYSERIRVKDLPKSSPTGYTIYAYLRAYVDNINNAGIKGFRFYSSTDQFGPYTLLASVPIQMWAESAYSRFYDYDPDLTPGIPSKYYAFSAWTDEGESSINIKVRVTPLDKFILVSPPNGATGVGTTPTFTWQPVANAHEYNIEVYRKDNYGWYDRVWSRWDIPAGTTSITYGEGGYYAAEPLNPGDECLWIMDAYGYNYSAKSMSYPRTFRP